MNLCVCVGFVVCDYDCVCEFVPNCVGVCVCVGFVMCVCMYVLDFYRGIVCL